MSYLKGGGDLLACGLVDCRSEHTRKELAREACLSSAELAEIIAADSQINFLYNAYLRKFILI
jgi:hypothetical protein